MIDLQSITSEVVVDELRLPPVPLDRPVSTGAPIERTLAFRERLAATAAWGTPDGDVDGADLAEFMNAFSSIELEAFASDFGRVDCRP